MDFFAILSLIVFIITGAVIILTLRDIFRAGI